MIVTRNRSVAATSVTWVDLTAVDGRSEIQEPDHTTGAEKTVRLPLVEQGDRVTGHPLTCPTLQECLRLAVLPGRHVVVLSAGSNEPDRRDSHKSGQARFTAEPGGLYSLHACRPKKGNVVFWVRDEKQMACVSTVCPRE